KGKIVWEGDYKAFGKAKATSFDGFTNNIRFQGQYFDEETGLHYNRYRYYDPIAGRYVSKDPIGLKGGLNTFGYLNNPTQGVDRLGLAGAIPKNFGKGKPINPLPNPVESAKASQSMTQDLVDAVKGLFGFNTKIYLPDDTFSCVVADCYPGKTCTKEPGVATKYTGPNKIDKPIGGEPFVWPPTPLDMPEGCVCTKEEIRKDMSGLKPPGL
ncbi:RHS repeat-associated core domain-containing protein, partial [Variovorax sp. J22P271]|uniref:RHS repeat domain-containing protein n=1 Tax=Variovorax davisae TaxID=3053515 RepID=UPI002575D673